MRATSLEGRKRLAVEQRAEPAVDAFGVRDADSPAQREGIRRTDLFEQAIGDDIEPTHEE